MTPRAFSFNSPHGACTECQGLGAMIDFDPQPRRARRVEVARRRRDRAVGARRPQAGARGAAGAQPRLRHRPHRAVRQAAAKAARGAAVRRRQRARGSFEGILPNLRRRYDEGSWAEQAELEPYPIAAAVPGLPRQPAEAAEPVGEGQGPDDRRLRRPADFRGARGVRRAPV